MLPARPHHRPTGVNAVYVGWRCAHEGSRKEVVFRLRQTLPTLSRRTSRYPCRNRTRAKRRHALRSAIAAGARTPAAQQRNVRAGSTRQRDPRRSGSGHHPRRPCDSTSRTSRSCAEATPAIASAQPRTAPRIQDFFSIPSPCFPHRLDDGSLIIDNSTQRIPLPLRYRVRCGTRVEWRITKSTFPGDSNATPED